MTVGGRPPQRLRLLDVVAVGSVFPVNGCPCQADERSDLKDGVDHPLFLQVGDHLPGRAPNDAELLHHLHLGRDRMARQVLSAFDSLGEGLGDLDSYRPIALELDHAKKIDGHAHQHSCEYEYARVHMEEGYKSSKSASRLLKRTRPVLEHRDGSLTRK